MSQTAGGMPHNIKAQFHGYSTHDGKILIWGPDGIRQIGVTVELFEETQKEVGQFREICTQYEEKLIAEGFIKKPLTQEQVIEQQAEQLRKSDEALKQSQEMLQQIMEKLNTFTAGGMEYAQPDPISSEGTGELGIVEDPGPESPRVGAVGNTKAHGGKKPPAKRPG